MGDHNWIKDNFFVFTSENMDVTKTHLFGFAVVENKFYKNCDLDDERIDFSEAYGAFILIRKKGDEIIISQDRLGAYYIYLFQNNGYWAVSNSFWLLCDEVAKKYTLTLNEAIAVHYLNVPMSQLSVEHTLANEIQAVPLCSVLKIKKGKLMITTQEREFCKYAIDSQQAVAIIDQWIAKWAGMIKSVYDAKMPMQFDLSGGFDSRIVFALACAAGIDFNHDHVSVQSYVYQTKGEKGHYKDDYDIAEMIAEKFHFTLNKPLDSADREKLPQMSRYHIYEHVFMNTHKEVYFKEFVYKKPLFHFGGMCGEPVRGKVRSFDEWISMIGKGAKYKALAYKEFLYAYHCAKPSFAQSGMEEYIRLLNLYLSTWQRNHYGLTLVNNAIVNEYTIAPLGDDSLLQINPLSNYNVNTDIVYALILQRTCPQLLEVPFAGGEGFSSETLNYAKKISAKWPVDIQIKSRQIDISQLYRISDFGGEGGSALSAEQLLEQEFLSEKNKNLFLSKFGDYGKLTWDEAGRRYHDANLFFPSKYIATLVAITKTINYEKKLLPCSQELFTESNEISVMESLLKQQSESLILRKLLFQEYMEAGMYEKAETVLQEGFSLNHDVDALHYLYAQYLQAREDFKNALVYIEKCIQSDSDVLEYWKLYFRILVQGEGKAGYHTRSIIKKAKKVCYDHQSDYRYWMELAEIYASFGKYYAAVKSMHRALDLNSDDMNVYNMLLVYMRKRDRKKALKKAEETIRQYPFWHGGYAHIAYIAVEEKDYIKACMYMRQALELVPQHEGYRKLLKNYQSKVQALSKIQ